MKKVILLLAGLTGLSAVLCGALLAIKPDGAILDLPLRLLETSPFYDFLLPGLVLAIVVGGSQLLAFIAGIGKVSNADAWIFAAGILLGGWIIIQLILIREVNWMQIVIFSIGLLQVIYGMRNGRKMKNTTGCDIW